MGSISSLPPEVKDVTERYGFCIVDDRFDSEDAEYLIDKPYITTLQTKKALGSETWKRLDSELLTKRPDIWLRVYGDVNNLGFLENLNNLVRLSVNCLYEPIQNIQCISALQNLSELVVEDESITSFQFLNSLEKKLTSLSLSKTKSKKPTLEFLSRFTNLEALSIHGHTKEIDVIASLKNLKHLSLSGLTLSNLDFVAPLRELDSFGIDLIKCKNYDALHDVNIKELSVSEIRGLESLSFISDIKGIQNLDLSYLNKVTVLPSLASHKTITRLMISYMSSLEDINSLFTCKLLRDFHFSNSNTPLDVEDFKPLLLLKHLKYVTIGTGRAGKNSKIVKLLNESGLLPYEYYDFECT